MISVMKAIAVTTIFVAVAIIIIAVTIDEVSTEKVVSTMTVVVAIITDVKTSTSSNLLHRIGEKKLPATIARRLLMPLHSNHRRRKKASGT